MKIVDRKIRYYKVNLGLDAINPEKDQEIYFKINEDKTLSAISKGTGSKNEIILRPLLKELTAREYTEEINKFENQRLASPQDLESRIENMKE